MKKLGLKVESHPDPYHVAWITTTKLKVDKQCLVTLKLTSSRTLSCVMCCPLNSVTYFGFPMDMGLAHAGRANTYSFVDGNKKYTLTCAKDMPILKLKKCSFLTWKIVPSDDILGVAPNSMESSPFQRGRIDAAAMEWLEKQYPLWKSKAKANPKNKFPWYILYLLILESRVFK